MSDERVRYEDLDDVIGIAAQLEAAEIDLLDQAEVERVATELDIDPDYVDDAIALLRSRREAAATEKKARTRRLVIGFGGLGATLLVGAMLLVGVVLVQHGRLNNALLAVERQQAQVATVLERQQAVEGRMAGAASTASRDAEVAGAENRVAIETRRYDEAATTYNRRAGGLLGGVWTGLFGMPDRVPLSTEVGAWR